MVVEVAREIYDQWSVNHHFEMYDDVAPVLTELQRRGFIVGAISNSHRSLDAFADHFSLRNIITVSVSGFEHGYMKPHKSIFEAALERARVKPSHAMMVGDSMAHDIEGARNAGWRAVLLRRSGERPEHLPADVAIITTLAHLPALLP
jgi:putative hydrolase of the HAD superfamily